MKVKKPLPLLILGIVTAICLSLSQIAMVGAEPVDPQAYYDANKQTVSSIDDGDYFADVLDHAKTDDAYVAVMQEIVKVAAAYNAYVDGHKQADYFAKDWDEISHIMDLTLNYVKLSAENYLEYNKGDKHYNRVIDDGNSIDGNYKTIEATYENRRQAAKAEVAAKYDTLFKANKSYPDSSPKTKVGYYDAQGASELDAVKTQYDADVDALVFDAADYQGSVDEVNALTAQAKADMDAVRRNDVERAYDDLQDYYAIAKGTMAGDEDAAKQAAAASAQNGLDFLSGASSEVQREYSNQKKAFNDFFDENEIDDSAYRNRPTISTEDGAITVTAKDSTGAELDVFSAKFVLKADSLVPTDPKRRNAEVEIGKDNSKLSVAYIMDLFILNPVEVWSAPETYEGKAVTYHVTIDLDAFYKNYVEDSSTFFSKMIGLKKHGEDLTEKIDKCAEYLKNNDGSLCYRYSRGDGDGAATALKYSLESGTLTFETGALGTIAITTDEPSSLLLNPVFWLLMIALVILLIIIIIILVKFAKYKIKFYSNGGSDVKPVWARKGEHFVMPENPTREGYVFAGWFEDEELTLRFLETEVTARRGLKAYAKWAEIVAATEEVEEPAPVEAAAAVGPTEQQLIDFYAEVRRTALGYALATENEKAVDGMMLVRAYMKKDGVYVYAATDPEAAGVETAEGAIAEDTPACMVVTDDESLEKAKQLIDKTMTEYGLEPSGRDVGELKEGMSKGFGYRLKFEEPSDEAPADEAPAEEAAEEAPAEEAAEEAPAEEATEEAPAEEAAEEAPAEEATEEAPAEEAPAEEATEEAAEEATEEAPAEEATEETPAEEATEEAPAEEAAEEAPAEEATEEAPAEEATEEAPAEEATEEAPAEEATEEAPAEEATEEAPAEEATEEAPAEEAAEEAPAEEATEEKKDNE